jgi:hypothetical protein
MSDMMPPQHPYVIDNINFGGRFLTINYTDPTQQAGEIGHFDQLVFPMEIVEDDIDELSDLVCQIIEKVQVMRRNPPERVGPRIAGRG